MSAAPQAEQAPAFATCADPECRYEVASDATIKGWSFVAEALTKHYYEGHDRMVAYKNEALGRPGGTE